MNKMPAQTNTEASKTATLAITSISQFLAPIMGSAVTVALPSMGVDFRMEAVHMGWVSNAYMLAAAVLLIPIGRIADIYGRKKVFAYGIWLFAAASILCGISNSTSMLIASRVLLGIGSAMTFGTSLAILTSVFPPKERGRAIGINVGAVYLGLSLGPFIGGVLTEHLTWRSVFYMSALLALIVGILTLWKLKGEWAEARGEKFDLTGSINFSVSLLLALYGFAELPETLGVVLLVLGIIGMVVFVRRALKTPHPVLNIGLIRDNRAFTLSCIATFVNYSSTFAVTFLLSLYLQYNKGFSPFVAGLILISQSVVMTVFAPIAGRLSDKIMPQKLAAGGMAISCVGLLLLVFLSDTSDLWFIILGLVVLGLGYGFFSTPNTNAVMGSVEKRFLTVAAGTQATMRHSGMVFSVGIVMVLFAIYNIKGVQITPQYYTEFLMSQKVTYIIFAVLCFLSVFIQLAAREDYRGWLPNLFPRQKLRKPEKL
jgi:EmrB/QacA subfamily drug resistance transporter